MYRRHELGKRGENLACEYLLKNNYEIIKKNFRCKIGEIDIIAKDKDELVFIEVKTRGQKEYGTPAEAVNIRKQKHIYFVAEYFLLINNLENIFCRLDIIEIFISKDKININHIKNTINEKPYVENFDPRQED